MNKTSITLILALLAVVFVTGCNVPSTPETSTERSFRLAQSQQLDRRTFVDDWDNFWLIDRNFQLSKFHQRMGY